MATSVEGNVLVVPPEAAEDAAAAWRPRGAALAPRDAPHRGERRSIRGRYLAPLANETTCEVCTFAIPPPPLLAEVRGAGCRRERATAASAQHAAAPAALAYAFCVDDERCAASGRAVGARVSAIPLCTSFANFQQGG